MGCFLVSAAEAVITTAVTKVVEKKGKLPLDKAALAAAIAQGQAITNDPNASDDYTAESLAALENALLEGEIVYENSKATASQIAQATQNILNAINSLVPKNVDKTALQNAIDTANALDEDDYTDSTWQAVEDALAAGTAVLNNPSATQSQVDAATQAILDAIAALELDKSALVNAISAANALDADDYTDSTWQAVENAVTAGTAVLNDPNATADDIAQAAQDILDAINNLVPDKTELQNALDTANALDEDDYTPSSWQDIEDAITAGTAVLNDPDATVDEIAQATQDILDAINGLVPDKIALQNAIDTANALDEDDYTASSWQAVEDAVTDGTTVLNDPNATVDEIAQATQDILDAINNLIPDKTALQNAVDTANGLNEDDYTASTWDDLEDAVADGIAVLNDPDATVDEIAQATQDILDAINNLSTDVNITVLDDNDQLIESVVVTVNTTYEDIIDQLTQVSSTDGDKILVGFTDENGNFVDPDATVNDDSVIRPYYELTQIVPKSTSGYLVDRTGEDGIINGFDINANSVDEVKANLENDEFCIEIVDINGNDLAGLDKVGTGSVITYKSKLTGNVYERLIVVIYGDVDGDGIVGADDRAKIRDVTYCTDIVSNNIYLKMASDVDGDGAFDGIDCSYISYSMHGMVCIEQARTIVLPV